MKAIIAVAVFLVAVTLTPAWWQQHKSQPPSPDGFHASPEEHEVEKLINSGQLVEAKERAKQMLDRAPASFDSPKRERHFKSNAHYLIGEIDSRSGDADAESEFRKAAKMGHASAFYRVASYLTLRAKNETSIESQAKLFEEAMSFYQAGAELGEVDCMEILARALSKQNRVPEANYWFILQQMNEQASDMETIAEKYRRLPDSYRENFASFMNASSLSGGPVKSDVKGLPGRSPLTAAFVDLAMRKQLEFVWRAFFSPSAPDEPLIKTFEHWRNVVPKPFAEPFLIVPQPLDVKAPTIISVSSVDDITSRLLNGDSIVVRCGLLTHEATLWSLPSNHSDYVLLLDPYYEFWQPSHNACVSHLKLIPYRYQRDLVQVRFSEMRNILQAVITIRDSRTN
jgi:tetratricopeptide (TPR) repeat protein